MGKVAVVGDQQQSRRILVQSARGEESVTAQLGRQKIEHGALSSVFGRRDDPFGLVHHIIDVLLIGQRLTVQRHRIGFGIDLGIGGADDRSVIVVNPTLTLKGIPQQAYDYVVNGQSAIEHVMEWYGSKKWNAQAKKSGSGIVNNPNDWAKEHNKPRYILDLLLSIINVSVQTVDIVNGLPEVDWDKE